MFLCSGVIAFFKFNFLIKMLQRFQAVVKVLLIKNNTNGSSSAENSYNINEEL